jgi:hypothetical protein
VLSVLVVAPIMVVVSTIVVSTIVVSTIVVTMIAIVAPMVMIIVDAGVFVCVTPVMIVIMVVFVTVLVCRLVFLGSNEVYGTVARVVFPAVLAPIFRVPRRYVQIDGGRRSALRLDQHRLRIHERRRAVIADLYLTVHTGRNLTR